MSLAADPPVNIAAALTRQAEARPDGIALIIPRRRGDGWQDVRYSYLELDQLSSRLASGLVNSGIGKGARVAFMVPPSLEFFALFFALFKAGCVPVLIDPGIGLRPLRKCLGEARPQAFIGITRAQVARLVLGWARESIRTVVTVGPRLGWGGVSYSKLAEAEPLGDPVEVAPDDPAAILFTSGSTGIPKGVVYRHRHFAAQVELVRDSYNMQPGEVDLPTFPPFALFDPALGMATVIPPMDFTRPARVDPGMLVSLIERYQVTNLFGSPALINTLGRHLAANQIRLPTLRRALSAGAPVSPQVLERLLPALADEADVHTPYGATEVLPVATVSGRQLLGGLSNGHRRGKGVCVGRPLAANRVAIITIDDGPLERLEDAETLAPGQIGEICVSGPTVTDCYYQRPEQTALAKCHDAEGRLWHRMGDLGWMDDEGRLWFCGRKSERVRTAEGELYTEPVEGRMNQVPGVYRSALVGVGVPGAQRPVLCIELEPGADRDRVAQATLEFARGASETRSIETVLVHRGFPVDIRHNAKIRRAELACWAARRLARG